MSIPSTVEARTVNQKDLSLTVTKVLRKSPRNIIFQYDLGFDFSCERFD